MLPLSCLRCADSKSNSSTRLPRRTTTRVSSGWVASMSILLAICKSHEGRRAALFVPKRRRTRRAASLSVKGTDRVLRSAGSVVPAGARCMNAALPIRSNLLRLEHRLQTVVDGDDVGPPRYCQADDIRQRDPRRIRRRNMSRTVGSGCPAPLRASAASSSSALKARECAGMGSKPAFARGLFVEDFAADVPRP